MTFRPFGNAIVLLTLWISAHVATGAALNLLTKRSAAIALADSGTGDSMYPVMTPDGRYIVFASRAENLVTNRVGLAAPVALNVFLRDRQTQATTLVSLDVNGIRGGSGDSIPADISSDGRYVLFESFATNLVAGDTNNSSDVFIRDVVNGQTLLVSAATNGGFGNRTSRGTAMTPDGRFVTFVSDATNLVAGDNNGIADVFVRDMQLGTTVMASPGGTPAGARNVSPAITPDGRYVAFMSTATGLAAGGNAAGRVYLRDTLLTQTKYVCSNAVALASNVYGHVTFSAYGPVVSDDGRYVAFQVSPVSARPKALVVRFDVTTTNMDVITTNGVASMDYENARNIDMTPDGRFIAYTADNNCGFGTKGAVYIWDAQTSNSVAVSVATNGAVALGLTQWPVVDSTGRYVAFFSTGTNLVTNAVAGGNGLYLRDVVAGTTTLINLDFTSVSPITAPVMSSNAQVIAYDGEGLLGDGPVAQSDVFVRDLTSPNSELVSVRNVGLPPVSPAGHSAVTASCLSSNGRFLAFSSRAEDLVTNDSNFYRDVFVQDRVNGINVLVSVSTNGVSANGPSYDASISSDGRYVAFVSQASNLVTGVTDSNKLTDIYMRDVISGTTALMSVATNGTAAGNGASSSPMVSADGRFVLFHSQASNLAVNNANDNLYLRDTQLGTTSVLTTNGSATLASFGTMSTSGRFIAYVGTSNSAPCLFVSDLQINQQVQAVAVPSGVIGVAVSADGSRAAMVTLSVITIINVLDGTTVTNIADTSTHGVLRFSANGHTLIYAHSNIFAYSDGVGVPQQITVGYDGGANGISDYPDISADGRFATFVSSASNLVTNDFNGLPDVFITGLQVALPHSDTQVISASTRSGTANGRSLTPYFSPDGHTLVFESWAGDIVAQDFNQFGDLFAFNVATIAPTYPGDPVLMFETPVTFSGVATAYGGVTFSWSVDPTRVYTVEFKDDLNDPQWHEFEGTTSTIGTTQFAQDVAEASQRFYRVIVQ